MQELAITLSCDMTYREAGVRRPAVRTVYLALGDDPRKLKVIQLDLSDDWSLRLDGDLAPYLAAGHEPGLILSPGQQPKNTVNGDGKTPRQRGQDRVSREYNTAMRAWCDKTGFTPGYVTLDSGGFRYSRPLQAAYADHLIRLAAGEPALPGTS